MNCWNCKGRNIVKGYIERTINKHNSTTKQWCRKCLTKYANTNMKYTGDHMPKLRDTNIDKYNEAINDYRFIPLASRMKINQQTGEVMLLHLSQ